MQYALFLPALFLPLFSLFSYEVLTLAQPIVDHVVFVSDEFLATIPGEKGGSELVDNALFLSIFEKSNSRSIRSPGGSSGNVVRSLAQLGHDCAMVGSVGSDEAGAFYIACIENQGITSLLSYSSLPTGQSAILVTPDGERTMRTVLGAAADTSHLSLETKLFEGIRLFHIEGYQLFDEALVLKAIQLAKEVGATISMDLGSFEVVKIKRAFILSLLEQGKIDILLANEQEAFLLTGAEAQEACAFLATLCSVAIVTVGKEGCWAQQGEERFLVPAFSARTLDTTGAGDFFTSGFLHGFLTGTPLKRCAELGALIAAHVVEVIGADLPNHEWDKIRACLLSHPLESACREQRVSLGAL